MSRESSIFSGDGLIRRPTEIEALQTKEVKCTDCPDPMQRVCADHLFMKGKMSDLPCQREDKTSIDLLTTLQRVTKRK